MNVEYTLRANSHYRFQKHALSAFKGLALTLIILVVISPIVWMVITSFKSKVEMYTIPVNYWPTMPTLEHFEALFSRSYLFRSIYNSLILSTMAPLLCVVCATMSAYAIARFRFRGNRLVLMFFLMTQMLPSATAIIPMYVTLARMGLINQISTLVFMLGAGGISFGVILLQGFIANMPDTIEEAALVDGCTKYQTFWHVSLPLLKGGIFTVFIFRFIDCWNTTYTSMVYLDSPHNLTLPVLISSLISRVDINWGQVAAATTLSLIPTCILFGVMKNLFVEGITAGAVKG